MNGKKPYRFDFTCNWHHIDLILCNSFSCRSKSMADPILAATRFGGIYLHADMPTVSYVQLYHVPNTLLQINYMTFWCQPWHRVALATTMACDARTPQPRVSTSSPHYGQWCVPLVWYHSLMCTGTYVANRQQKKCYTCNIDDVANECQSCGHFTNILTYKWSLNSSCLSLCWLCHFGS